jgi:predicted amidohydrolase
MTYFSIAGLQLELSGRDNRYLIQKEIEALLRRFPWVDMVLLGELATHGADPAAAETLPGKTEKFYCELAQANNVWLLPGSILEKHNDTVYNTASVINPAGEVAGRYRKMFPWCPYEKGITPGEDFLVFDVPEVGRFGVSICYISSMSMSPARWATADLLLSARMERFFTRLASALSQCPSK